MSMIETPPDCGAPCALCESYAHNAARLQAVADRQAAEIARANDTIMRLRAALVDIQFAGHVGYARNLATKLLEETQ